VRLTGLKGFHERFAVQFLGRRCSTRTNPARRASRKFELVGRRRSIGMILVGERRAQRPLMEGVRWQSGMSLSSVRVLLERRSRIDCRRSRPAAFSSWRQGRITPLRKLRPRSAARAYLLRLANQGASGPRSRRSVPRVKLRCRIGAEEGWVAARRSTPSSPFADSLGIMIAGRLRAVTDGAGREFARHSSALRNAFPTSDGRRPSGRRSTDACMAPASSAVTRAATATRPKEFWASPQQA
jgi:hypothetical protein